MLFMSEYEVEETLHIFDGPATPNLAAGAMALARLVEWTNRNSDGWPYWPKPSRAAKSLMEALEAARKQYYAGREVEDISAAELARVLRPIKAFLTRQGASHDVLKEP